MDPDAQTVHRQLQLGTDVDAMPMVPEQLETDAEPLVAQFEEDRDIEAFVTAQGIVVEEVEEEEAKVRAIAPLNGIVLAREAVVSVESTAKFLVVCLLLVFSFAARKYAGYLQPATAKLSTGR
jgi:C4-dicarboxylate-specific signal transduction histidine kinase